MSTHLMTYAVRTSYSQETQRVSEQQQSIRQIKSLRCSLGTRCLFWKHLTPLVKSTKQQSFVPMVDRKFLPGPMLRSMSPPTLKHTLNLTLLNSVPFIKELSKLSLVRFCPCLLLKLLRGALVHPLQLISRLSKLPQLLDIDFTEEILKKLPRRKRKRANKCSWKQSLSSKMKIDSFYLSL